MRSRVGQVFWVALRLGLTSFGGPIAHIGYFREEYVARRKWVDEATFADLVALSNFLPGAASSKLGMSIGMIRAGLPGAVAAWVGFTTPSAILIVAFAYGAELLGDGITGWLDGLRIVAVAVVALAVWQMGVRLAPDLPRGSLAILAAVAQLTVPWRHTTVAIVVAAGLAGFLLFRRDSQPDRRDSQPDRPPDRRDGRSDGQPDRRDKRSDGRGAGPQARLPAQPAGRPARLVAAGPRSALLAAGLLFGLLAALPLLRQITGNQTVAVVDSFYRSGALVFGGGNVVLPLLDTEVLAHGWVTSDQFLTGYGAAQAVPGPLFTFAAYLGTVLEPAPTGVVGAAIALLAIFLPSFLIVVATLPSLGAIRGRPAAQAVLEGVNAAVVGVLLAALYDPLWLGAITGAPQLALALVAFGLLAFARLPAWLVVLVTAAGGAGLAALAG